MRMPNEKDEIKVTTNHYICKGQKLDILQPSEVYIKEKTDEYIVIYSSDGIVEVIDGKVSLYNSTKEITIKKGEIKTLTLPMTDYFSYAIIEY